MLIDRISHDASVYHHQSSIKQIFSRRYFFSGALLAFAIVSSYAWAQFPYDNICLPDNPTSVVASTYDNVMILNGTVTSITVTEDEAFRFCNQHWRAYSGIAFPASPRWQENGLNWMTPNQETLTTLYGWTSLVVLIVFILAVFGGTMVRYALSWIHGMYSVSRTAAAVFVAIKYIGQLLICCRLASF